MWRLNKSNVTDVSERESVDLGSSGRWHVLIEPLEHIKLAKKYKLWIIHELSDVYCVLEESKHCMSTIFHGVRWRASNLFPTKPQNTSWVSDSHRQRPQLILDVKDLLKVNHCLNSQHNQGRWKWNTLLVYWLIWQLLFHSNSSPHRGFILNKRSRNFRRGLDSIPAGTAGFCKSKNKCPL